MPQVNVKLWLFEYRNIGTNGFLRHLNRLMVSVFSVVSVKLELTCVHKQCIHWKLWSECQTVNIRGQASSHQSLC